MARTGGVLTQKSVLHQTVRVKLVEGRVKQNALLVKLVNIIVPYLHAGEYCVEAYCERMAACRRRKEVVSRLRPSESVRAGDFGDIVVTYSSLDRSHEVDVLQVVSGVVTE